MTKNFLADIEDRACGKEPSARMQTLAQGLKKFGKATLLAALFSPLSASAKDPFASIQQLVRVASEGVDLLNTVVNTGKNVRPQKDSQDIRAHEHAVASFRLATSKSLRDRERVASTERANPALVSSINAYNHWERRTGSQNITQSGRETVFISIYNEEKRNFPTTLAFDNVVQHRANQLGMPRQQYNLADNSVSR